MPRITIMMALMLLLSGILGQLAGGRASVGGFNGATTPTVEVTVLTDKLIYPTGDPVHITVRVTNMGGFPITLTFASSCQAAYRVKSLTGILQYDLARHIACLMVLTTLTLQPGESHDDDLFAWKQVDDAGNPVPSPGDYIVQGYLLGQEPEPSGLTTIAIHTSVAQIPSGGKWMNAFPRPSARDSHAMAYDSWSDQVFLFGGVTGAGNSGETWAYDLNANKWKNMNPSNKPPALGGHAMVYDSRADRIILFGGTSAAGYHNETWAYDANANSWTNMNPASMPSARDRYGLSYDSQSDRVILFGGITASFTQSDETWAYDFERNEWANMSPEPRPSARWLHAMTYDAESDRVILFGGGTASGCCSDETWTYDFDTNRWTNMNPPTKPSSRYSHAMAYDTRSDQVVLFGGWTGVARSDETWVYDLNTNTWTNMNPAPRPSSRFEQKLAYDIQSDRVVLFGGTIFFEGRTYIYSDETWAYDLETDTWTNRFPSPSPGSRYAMAYDSWSDRVILFGGIDPALPTSGTESDQTWAYNFRANAWTNMNPPTRPSARAGHAMVYDSRADRIVLFGGYDNETWAYDFGTNIWMNMKPARSPSIQWGHAMAYDAESDRVILFGGCCLSSETWAYDFERNTWTNMNPAIRPAGRVLHAMAYDAESDRVILFGGVNGGPQTWAYDFNKNTWTNMNPATGPFSRYVHAMAYDSRADRVILFGGIGGGDRSNDTWSYDFNTNTWKNMNPATTPSARGGHAMVYDVQSDRMVLFGGGGYNETWWYQSLTYPSAPQNFQLTPGGAQVVLAWQPPSSDGGSPITGYRIYRGTSPGSESLLAAVGNVLAYTDTAVAGGVTYYYRVAAVNAAGEGTQSNEVSARVLTPQEAIGLLMDDIDGLAASGSLPRTLATPLTAKLKAATMALDRHQASVAINVLQAFVHEVEAQVRAGRLTPQVGNELTRQACEVILALYGTC